MIRRLLYRLIGERKLFIATQVAHYRVGSTHRLPDGRYRVTRHLPGHVGAYVEVWGKRL